MQLIHFDLICCFGASVDPCKLLTSLLCSAPHPVYAEGARMMAVMHSVMHNRAATEAEHSEQADQSTDNTDASTQPSDEDEDTPLSPRSTSTKVLAPTHDEGGALGGTANSGWDNTPNQDEMATETVEIELQSVGLSEGANDDMDAEDAALQFFVHQNPLAGEAQLAADDQSSLPHSA